MGGGGFAVALEGRGRGGCGGMEEGGWRWRRMMIRRERSQGHALDYFTPVSCPVCVFVFMCMCVINSFHHSLSFSRCGCAINFNTHSLSVCAFIFH